jgi:hypothetical protein
MEQDTARLWNDAVSTFKPRANEAFYPLLFLPDDFRVPDSEQFLELYQGIDGVKSAYPTLIDFAASTLFSFLEDTSAQSDFVTVAATARCTGISPGTFLKQLSQRTEGLKNQPAFAVNGQIIQACRLFDEWNFSAGAAETLSNYYAFFWETTA